MSNQLQQKEAVMRLALVLSCCLAIHLIQGSLSMAIEGGTCPPEAFMCMDGSQCIDSVKRCDGMDDCPDGTDEYECKKADTTVGEAVPPAEPASECAEDSFHCKDDESVCVSKDKQCDGIPQCKDASDELDCIGRCKQPENFLCHDGRCMTGTVLCNGIADCSDGSDESNCTMEQSSGESIEQQLLSETISYKKGNCSADEFHCLDDTCIPNHLKCDGKGDCPDRSDEYQGCMSGSMECADGFVCGNGHCIAYEWYCDGVIDCLDGSDEQPHCNKTKSRPIRASMGRVDEERIKNLREEREFRKEIHHLQMEEMQMKQDVVKEELSLVKNASEIAEALAKEQLQVAALERQAAEDKLRQQSELFQLKVEAAKPETPTIA